MFPENSETYNVLGVMSGTSLDGIDLAFAQFTKGTTWRFEIMRAETVPYPKAWQKKLFEAINLPPEELNELNAAYTRYLAQAINRFIAASEIKSLDAICSHGHTVLHEPEKGVTLQIGNLKALAKLTGQRVICDFRVEDVALGGQGAPLVPIGDALLFNEYDACINLGGFANISYRSKKKRIAYDICPVNVVLNHFANLLGMDYDRGGEVAASQKVHNMLRQELNMLPFYKEKPPKSLGMEWVNKTVMPVLEQRKISPQRALTTFTEHIAEQIAKVINLQKKLKLGRVLLTGGGAYNSYLISCIACKTHAELTLPQPVIIDYKEALIFGFLGVLRLRNEINVLKSVTGASHDHCAGKIYTP